MGLGFESRPDHFFEDWERKRQVFGPVVSSFFLPFLSLVEELAVRLHQLAGQEEGVDSGNAVADEVGNELAFAVGLLRSRQIMPKTANLLAVGL